MRRLDAREAGADPLAKGAAGPTQPAEARRRVR
jgi:hypothetical protein